MRAGEADHGHSIHAREERLFTAPIPALVILIVDLVLAGVLVSALYAAAVMVGAI